MFLSILVSWIAIMSGLYTLYIYIYANCGWLGVFVNFRYTGISNFLINNRPGGLVVPRSPRVQEVVGSIPGRVIPKTLKLVVAASPPSARHIYR
jgi:hypothetical protein